MKLATVILVIALIAASPSTTSSTTPAPECLVCAGGEHLDEPCQYDDRKRYDVCRYCIKSRVENISSFNLIFLVISFIIVFNKACATA